MKYHPDTILGDVEQKIVEAIAEEAQWIVEGWETDGSADCDTITALVKALQTLRGECVR